MKFKLITGVLLLGYCISALASGTPERLALVIGNSTYDYASKLKNPSNDAAAVARAFQRMGYSVSLKTDLNLDEMLDSLEDFTASAQGAKDAVIYFAGHGVEANGKNYILPVDARLANERRLAREAVPLDELLLSVRGAKRLQLVLLDSCRNNPLANNMQRLAGTRSTFRGLSRPVQLESTLVAYATAANTLALDGSGKHSPFTEGLLAHMETPGLDIRLMFGKVRDYVQSKYQQSPSLYGTLGGDSIFLAAPGSSSENPLISEARAWASAACSVNNTVGCNKYLGQYPNGQFAVLARFHIQREQALQESTANYTSTQSAMWPRQGYALQGAYLRSGPSTQDARRGQIAKYSTITVLGFSQKQDWLKVEFEGRPAYIAARLLTFSPPTDTEKQTEKATTQALLDDPFAGMANSTLMPIKAPKAKPLSGTEVISLHQIYTTDEQLSSAGLKTLETLAARINATQSSLIQIAGHTDSNGTYDYNIDLSRRSAETIAKVLASFGVDRSRLHPIGYGESRPVAVNSTALGRQQNRRVEIRAL